jgi:hypothetical protein
VGRESWVLGHFYPSSVMLRLLYKLLWHPPNSLKYLRSQEDRAYRPIDEAVLISRIGNGYLVFGVPSIGVDYRVDP